MPKKYYLHTYVLVFSLKFIPKWQSNSTIENLMNFEDQSGIQVIILLVAEVVQHQKWGQRRDRPPINGRLWQLRPISSKQPQPLFLRFFEMWLWINQIYLLTLENFRGLGKFEVLPRPWPPIFYEKENRAFQRGIMYMTINMWHKEQKVICQQSPKILNVSYLVTLVSKVKKP